MKRIIVGAMLFGLCACGGSDAASTTTSTASASGSAATSSAPAAEAPSPEGSTADGPKTASNVSKDLCSFLTKEVPRLEARGSSVGALAGFAVDYAGWIAEDPNRKLKDAAELDAITTSTCPKVREDILKVLDSDSFVQVLTG